MNLKKLLKPDFILIILAVIIGIGILNSSYFRIRILDYGLRIIGILVAFWALIYSIKMGISTVVLREILKETSEKTGLSLNRPKTLTSKLRTPLTSFLILEGVYKNYHFIITPLSSIFGPLGGRMSGLSWGHVGMNIEIGPFKINYNNPKVKRESTLIKGKYNFFIELPPELKYIQSTFGHDLIIKNNKLILQINYKCPRKSDDLIKIMELLIKIADEVALNE